MEKILTVFFPVELSEVQDLGQQGEVVIGVDAAHIVMAMPGDEKYSESWKVDVPGAMDTGSGPYVGK